MDIIDRLNEFARQRDDKDIKVVWKRNARGGQKIGNIMLVRPATMRDFIDYVLPHTRAGFYGNGSEEKQFATMRARGHLWISLISKDDGKTWVLGKIGPEDQVKGTYEKYPQWAMVVDDVDDPDALAWRQQDDEETPKVQEAEVGQVLFRGDEKPITIKGYDVEAGIKAGKELGGAMAEGPGIYFTTDEKNALSYGKNLTKVYLKPDANILRVTDDVLPNTLIKKILASVKPEHIELALSNWDEDKTVAMKEMLDAISDADDPVDQLINIWADVFYHQNPQEFMDAVAKNGIDGIAIDRERGIEHYAIYNRKALVGGGVNESEEDDEDVYYAWADILQMIAFEIISEYEEHINEPDYVQKWDVVPAARVMKIWNDYATSGVVRDERGMAEIKDRMIENVAKLYVNTVLTGHTPDKPETFAEERTDHKYEDGYFDKLDHFFDDGHGQWRLSDYALEPLMNLAAKLLAAKTAEKQLQIADRMLNVIHQRGDIAALFIEGGKNTLNKLAGVDVNETTFSDAIASTPQPIGTPMAANAGLPGAGSGIMLTDEQLKKKAQRSKSIRESIEQEIEQTKDSILLKIAQKIDQSGLSSSSVMAVYKQGGTSAQISKGKTLINTSFLKKSLADTRKILPNDIGSLQLMENTLDDGVALSKFDEFSGYDNLAGTTINMVVDGVALIYSGYLSMGYNVTETISVLDKSILDRLDDRSLKVVGNTVYPVGGRFTPAFFDELSNAVSKQEAEDDDEADEDE